MLEYLGDRFLGNAWVLLGTDRLMLHRIERLSQRGNLRDLVLFQNLQELVLDGLDAVRQGAALARLPGVLDGTLEVIEHGKQVHDEASEARTRSEARSACVRLR